MSTMGTATTRVLGLTLIVATVLLVSKTGSILVSVGIVSFALIALWLLQSAPSSWSLALLFAAMAVDDPQSLPNEGRWKSPFNEPGRLLFENLRHITGIESQRFSLFELLVATLAVTLLLRRSFAPQSHESRLRKDTRVLRTFLAVASATVVWLCVYGQLRGGDFRQSMWQGRQLFWLPILGFVFLETLTTEEARRRLLWVVVLAATLRASLGLYYYFIICRPDGYLPHYATSHSDTLLFGAATIIAIARLLEQNSRRSWVLAAVIIPLMLAAMAANNRRLAYVALAACVASSFPLWRPAVRRFLWIASAIATPVLALYLALGWSSGSRFFRPAYSIRTMISSEDTSTETREIENYNLTTTALARPILGQGLGHPYDERVVAYSIEANFEQYRFIAHNSVLWLLSVGGLIGFLGIWIIVPLTSLYAWRAYRRARSGSDRVSAVFSHSIVVLYLAQAYGDIGMQSWLPTLVLGAALGMVGNLMASLEARAEDATRRRSSAEFGAAHLAEVVS
ncbi:MAG: O-antigen ligase family protein [Deltaproteobacteria bacterium]|nr:O-antigen ligase family protein [Deltaproteobacteria bacterium]